MVTWRSTLALAGIGKKSFPLGSLGDYASKRTKRYLCTEETQPLRLCSVRPIIWFQDHNLGQGRLPLVAYFAEHSITVIYFESTTRVLLIIVSAACRSLEPL